jgi:DNA-binding response OmpR family regulator
MKRHVLVVAGDAPLRATIARILQPAGYAVELAGEEQRARELIAGGRVDAMIVAPTSLGACGAKLDARSQ